MDIRLLHFPAYGCTPKAHLADTAMVGFHASPGPLATFRVPHVGQRDEVEAIGDRAEMVALTFQFGRVTGPPPFEISN
ncbi:hypothetical protein [Micromonospora sp. NPDC005197]|uniref:hypothetical protein n=1 Tax=unclassified Micromonospora TaxID=2617518 RepID=UPI0033B5D561